MFARFKAHRRPACKPIECQWSKGCITFVSLLGLWRFGIAYSLSAHAQALTVVPDGTTATRLLDGGDCSRHCTVVGGSHVGDNLFHSFDRFSISEAVTVTIRDQGAANIFARVLQEASTINGTLSILGDAKANFFLINSQGITFGPQATLVSSGSFVASTAESITFADKTDFGTVNATDTRLTVSAPAGLQFGNQPGTIVNRAQDNQTGTVTLSGRPAGLHVPSGEALALLGGPVVLEGGRLTASSGRIELGSVTENSLVSVSSEFAFGYQKTSGFGDLQITNGGGLDVSGSGGSVFLRGHGIEISDRAFIANTNTGDLSSAVINLTAEDAIALSGFGIFFSADPGSAGNGASLNINARELTVSDGALVVGGTLGTGNGGSITIDTSETTTLRGVGFFSPTLVTTSSQATGRGGDLTIYARELHVLDGAQIQAVTYGSGTGGSITVNATDRLNVSGSATMGSGTLSTSSLLASSGVVGLPFQPDGDGGNLTVTTEMLSVSAGAQLAVDSLGSGNSGDLNITAQTIWLAGQAQLSAAAAFGNGGNIQIEDAETLILRQGSLVSTRAGTGSGQGDGGNINIDADFVVTNPLENTDIIAQATQGRGGNIAIVSQGLYGIEERAAIAGNQTNDIDASSEFGVSGTIAIDQLIPTSDQTLVSISDRVLEADAAVTQGCQTTGNHLIVTGRGGMPAVPSGEIEVSNALVDLGERHLTMDEIAVLQPSTQDVAGAGHSRWREAQDWWVDGQNQVVLTAERSHSNGLPLAMAGASCVRS
ncbi:MAG: filamentous hemagglutinin N-terminal domain-containing protein [Cyanobacteria bacterium J06631_12]